MDFFDRLYKGFEAEYFIMGCFFSHGYEAFKMPADFGFDLLVTNQREQTKSRRIKKRDIDPPYAIQVKSRRLQERDFQEGPNGRLEADIEFSIKESDIDLIIENQNSFLVCVIYFEVDNDARTRTSYFWLNSSHIEEMDEEYSCFYSNPARSNSLSFRAKLRLNPTFKLKTILDDLVRSGDLTKKGKTTLMREMPDELPMDWNARPEYISIARSKLNDEVDNLPDVFRMIPDDLTNFSHIGIHVPIPWQP